MMELSTWGFILWTAVCPLQSGTVTYPYDPGHSVSYMQSVSEPPSCDGSIIIECKEHHLALYSHVDSWVQHKPVIAWKDGKLQRIYKEEMFQCPEKVPVLEEAIKTHLGEEFGFSLKSYADGGYSWELVKPIDETKVKFLRIIPPPEPDPYHPCLGQCDLKEGWLFLAVGRGQTEIELQAIRAWEDIPIKKVKVIVFVQ